MSHRYYMSNGDARFVFHADHATSPEHFRPVAVIDPTDTEQVFRLVELLGEHGWIPTKGHGLRDALREFAAPTPQPCTAAVTVDEVVRPCELGGDHDGDHSVHHGATRVTWSVAR